MKNHRVVSALPIILVALAAACGTSVTLGEGFGDGDGNIDGNGNGGSGGGGSTSTQVATATAASSSSVTSTSTGGAPCASVDPAADEDGDGFTPATGDCDDCDPLVGPGSAEVLTPPGGVAVDEDCSGAVDDLATCDSLHPIDDADPTHAAQAIELCKVASGPGDWGLVGAQWVMADGSASPGTPEYHLGHGLLPAFGAAIVPREGAKMLALSTGTARQPTDPGYVDPMGYAKNFGGNHPAGYPKEAPACPGVVTGTPYDDAALEVTVRAPANATGFAFDFDFYTYEWPTYICSSFNDFFVALLSPIPAGQLDGNISFDSQGNSVSVNNAFLDVCGCGAPPPCMAGGKSYACALGTASLVGTGFGADSVGGMDHGSTEWLVTSAPITAGEVVSLRLAVYDSGDGVLDTTTLLDNWRWLTGSGPVVQTLRVQD